jgi:hypothetical protein
MRLSNITAPAAIRLDFSTFFRREDPAVTPYREWAIYKDQPLHYSEPDSWDQMLQQGIQLLERFSQEDRIRIRQPRGGISRSSSCVRSLEAMNSWPMLMPSEDSTAVPVCSNGRPLLALRKNRKDS